MYGGRNTYLWFGFGQVVWERSLEKDWIPGALKSARPFLTEGVRRFKLFVEKKVIGYGMVFFGIRFDSIRCMHSFL